MTLVRLTASTNLRQMNVFVEMTSERRFRCSTEQEGEREWPGVKRPNEASPTDCANGRFHEVNYSPTNGHDFVNSFGTKLCNDARYTSPGFTFL